MMSRLRFVPIVLGAIALHSGSIAAQQAPIPKPFASFKCTYTWCTDYPRTSPNGRFVAHGGPNNIQMYEVATRQSWTVVEGEGYELTWSPRGDRIAFVRDAADDNYSILWSVPIDANTGKARGPAQRVSVGYSSGGSISPDGKWIVYEALDSVHADIAIVPTTGGPSRVLVPNKGGGAVGWTANSAAFFAVEWEKGKTKGDIVKIRVDNGATEMIYKGGGSVAGMSVDRQYLVVIPVIYTQERSARGEQGTVIDTTGRVVGRFPLPVGEKQFDRILGDSAIVWVTATDRQMLEVRPVAAGAARRLPLIGESNAAPLWSPDGKRIAFQVREAPRHTVLAVSSPDGTNPRMFRDFTSIGEVHWSPDSRSLAIMNIDRHTLSVVDVTTGAQRTLLSDTATTVGAFLRWNADGRSLITLLIDVNAKATAFYYMSLRGERTKITDFRNYSGPVATPTLVNTLVGTSDRFMRSDSGAFIQPLVGGKPRWIVPVPAGTRLNLPTVSPDLKWLAAELVTPKRTGNSQIELWSTATGARTVLDLPFVLLSPPEFVPGDGSLLALGRSGGSQLETSGSAKDSLIRIYRIPLNGDAPRLFGEVGMRQRWQGTPPSMSVSPDGKFVVYSVQPEQSTISIGLISLRGAIPGSASRAPQR